MRNIEDDISSTNTTQNKSKTNTSYQDTSNESSNTISSTTITTTNFSAMDEILSSMTTTEKITMDDSVTAPVLTASNIDSETNLLSWTSVNGAKSYILYLLNVNTGRFEKYGEIKSTSCKDKLLEPNTRYTYAVAAMLSNGKIGCMSDEVSIYTCNKIGCNISNINNENPFPSLPKIAVQGEWVYFLSYREDSCKNGGILKIKKDGTNLTSIKDEPQISSLNVIGNKIYYINNEFNAIMSCDLNGENEKTELIAKNYFDECKNYDQCEINKCIATENQLFFYMVFQQNFETEIYAAWYYIDLGKN